MDRLYESALKSLKKAQNEKRLLQILHVIRKNISTTNSEKNFEKIWRLKKEGCVKILVQYLKEINTNEEIINIVLSIVGYACLQWDVANEIIQKYEVLPIICDLMDSHNVDSIQGRIFRIIGNLCDGWNSNLVIEDTPQICKLLKSYFIELYEDDEVNPKSSTATITMALRASRKLLKKNTLLVVLNDEKILQHISAVFVKCSKQWIESKQNETILQDILKVVLHYSTFSNKEVVAQLRVTTAGDSLALLPDLIPLNPQRILRIVMNLTNFCPNKSDLPILNIMSSLNRLAVSTSEWENGQHIVYLQCLSDLLNHPGHREYVEKSGTIDILLNLFSNHKTPSPHSVACLNIIIDYLKKLPIDRFSTLLLPDNNFLSKHENYSANNESIDVKLNSTTKCRCTRKRDHKKSVSTSFNLRRNCDTSNCSMKISEISYTQETKIESDVDICLFNDETSDKNRHDFLKLLMAKLLWLEIKSSKIYLPVHTVNKNRRRPVELIDDICSKEEYSLKNEVFDFIKEDSGYFPVAYSTDERCISPSTSSDISSNGPFSPCRIMMKDDDSNSDDYSPICSDAEDSEAPQLSVDLPNIHDSKLDTTDTNLFEEKYYKELRDGIIKLCCNISNLLNILVVQKEFNFREKMATIELCRILLNASFQHVRVVIKTLLNIINTGSILMDFMFTDLILDVFEFTLNVHKDCTVCDRAKEQCLNFLNHCTKIAQDVSFKPNILHRIAVQKQNGGLSPNFVATSITLVSANYIEKKTSDVISPCNMNLLKRILVNDKGCDIFLSYLRLPTLISLHCLCKLVSHVIRIKNPRVNSILESVRNVSITYDFKPDNETVKNEQITEDTLITDEHNINCNEINKNHFITFIFDDQSKIKVNRELLIEKSDYFSRLLEGGFIESNQREIRLKNVKRNPFQFLIYLLSLNLTLPCTFTFSHLYLDVILDVILMADLYLLSDISCALTMYIEQQVISSKNVLQIYSWSLNSQTNLLRIEVVAYLMSREVQEQRVPMLQTFINAGLWDTLLDDIASLIKRHIQALK